MARPLLLAAGALAAYFGPAAAGYSPAARLLGIHQRLRRTTDVALTFDDGPQPGATEYFLELLAGLEVRATFFLVGEQVARFPALTRRIQAAGHEIGNHGYLHRNHLLRAPADVWTDLCRGRDAIAQATGRQPSLFRPPQGAVTAATRLAATLQSLAIVLWSAWGRDWRPAATRETIRDDVLARAAGGGIVLLHDGDYYGGRSWHATYHAVPAIVASLRQQGLRIGPIGGPGNLR